MSTYGFKDHKGYKTNRLTRTLDSEALTRFAKSLPRDRDCPIHGYLGELRRTYIRLAKKVRWEEVARERYEEMEERYGTDGTVIEINR